eukprot:scaffold55114_cov56-Phaeocystis_antarctica.AAC.1
MPTLLETSGLVKCYQDGIYQELEHRESGPPMLLLQHKTQRSEDKPGGFDFYKVYQEPVAVTAVTVTRSMLEITSARGPIALTDADVEPMEATVERFITGGMSRGTLLREARELLAISVSRACGRSSSGEDDDQAGDSDGLSVIVSEPALSAEAGPAGVLGCLAVCLLLLLRTERASRVSGGLRGCKPRGARGACASRRAVCRCLPRTAYHGLTRGVCRTALLLMLASWLGGCDAAGTVCSREPTACDGTYSGTSLCAPLPRLPCATNEGRAAEGVTTWLP